jgi:hypothetical protein
MRSAEGGVYGAVLTLKDRDSLPGCQAALLAGGGILTFGVEIVKLTDRIDEEEEGAFQ